MRAIIIEEERFAEVCELLSAIPASLHENGYLLKQSGLTEQQIKFATDEIHRMFHMTFVRWAQSHGARCVR